MDNIDIPDFTQLAKLNSLRLVPKDSGKAVYIVARLAFTVGAMMQFLIANPSARVNPQFTAHVVSAAHLMHQLDGGPIEDSEVKFQGLLDN